MKVVHNYNDSKVIIEFIDYCNINDRKLSILNVVINKNNNDINLGNFYNEENDIMDLNYFINDLDNIIFKKNRYIGNDKKIIKSINKNRKIDNNLKDIYCDFINSNDYKEKNKYSHFLELYFYSHPIPDTIRWVFLKNNNSSYLDFDDIDLEIKNQFNNSLKDISEEALQESRLFKLEKLKKENINLKDEINILYDILNKLKDFYNKISNYKKIVDEINLLYKDYNNLGFFDKNKRVIKNRLKYLKNILMNYNLVSLKDEIKKEYNEKYVSKYNDIKGFSFFSLFDDESILFMFEDLCIAKKKKYEDFCDKISELEFLTESYEDNSFDVSDLYERVVR